MTTYVIQERDGSLTVGTNDDAGVTYGDVIVVELHDENGNAIHKQGEIVEILD